MTVRKHHWVLTILLIIVLCANFLNVRSVQADGETPTEPPPPTQVEADPPTEPPPPAQVETEPPPEASVESTSEPVEATSTPLAEILTQIPENTEVVVLDESGDSVSLASQEAAEIVEVVDPMWCPEGVLPGGSGCTTNFPSITDLINNMITSTASYTQNGVIYFTNAPGAGTLNLTDTNLGTTVFQNLNAFNLTLQGGWNGSTASPTLNGQTNLGTNPITIGSSASPWVGNITLNNFLLNGVSSANAVTIYTTVGNITLSNVDVNQQTGEHYTALLNSNSGNITVQNGSTFDGDNTGSDTSRGFFANTNTGSITITGTSANPITFDDAQGPGATNYNGATLSASTVTLSHAWADQNDGNGFAILNASTVTLNNSTASNNRGNGFAISNASIVTLNNVTSGPAVNNEGNDLSGVLINGTGSTFVQVIGGTFADNLRYGIEIYNGSLFIQTAPVCPLFPSNTRNTLGCYNVTPSTDSTAPVITPNISGTAGSNGWYTSNVSVSWSVSDAESGIQSSTGCTASNLTSETTGVTLTCSATNNLGLSNSASVTIKIDTTAPILSLPADINVGATGATVVNYSVSATDNFDASPSAACSPASGSTFAIGTTTVNCSATDAAGNIDLGSFQVTVVDTTVVVVPPTPPTPPTSPTSPSSTSDSTLGSSTSQSAPSESIIPVTGGGVIDLDCNSTVWAFGIKLSFMNLCDYQTTLDSIDVDNLPGALPDGYTFVVGLDLNLLSENQAVEELPDGAGIQLDFPILDGSSDQFAVLYWNGDEWVEVSEQISDDQISQFVSDNSDNELHKVQSALEAFYQILTTNQTGIFVLVEK